MPCEAVRAFVVGPGEVGRRLAGALERGGMPVRLVGRHDDVPSVFDPDVRAPRVVAVREDDLGPLLARTPDAMRDRLVLVQNGFLEAVLGDLGPVTRVLVWFTSKGEFFREIDTTRLHGAWAGPLAEQLARGGLDVREITVRETFLREMILKGLWNCVVGLPLAVHGEDLATYLAGREDEWRALLDEGARAASRAYGVDVAGDEAAARLLETTKALGWVKGGTKALAFRNGALVAMGRANGVSTPVNERLLAAAKYQSAR